MYKQKQIEGIARALCGNFRKGVKGDNLCGQLAFKCECKCKHIASAENLYNAGYRKIPEGAVVILDEEMEEFAETLLKSPQMQKTMNGLIKAWEKETAEKFAEMLKALVADRNCNEDYDWEDVQVDGQIFVECVDEICKEITGVE